MKHDNTQFPSQIQQKENQLILVCNQSSRLESVMKKRDSAKTETTLEDEKKPKEQVSFLRRILNLIQKFRNVCGAFVNSSIIETLILLLIFINSLMMAIGTYEWVRLNPEVDDKFSQSDGVFLWIFTVELCLQFIFHGFRLFLDAWLVFDFSTIVLSWSFQHLQVIRSFRVLRALRVITKVKVLKNLIVALGRVLPSMNAIFMLLILLMIIFAIMLTNLLGEVELSEPYFVTFHDSFFTLFQMLTLDWIEPAREVNEFVSWAKYIIMFYILISGFVVYNLVIAVLCDTMNVINEDDDGEESVLKDEDGPRLQAQIQELTERINNIQKDQNRILAYVEDIAQSLLSFEEY